MADIFAEGNKASTPRQDHKKSEDDFSKTRGKSISQGSRLSRTHEKK